MGDIDCLSRGYLHSLDITKEYVMSPLQSTKLDALFRLLDPSVVNDVEDHHRVFDSVYDGAEFNAEYIVATGVCLVVSFWISCLTVHRCLCVIASRLATSRAQYLPVALNLQFQPEVFGESMQARFLRMRQNVFAAVAQCVQPSSRGTYETGWAKWIKFCSWFEVDPFLTCSPSGVGNSSW